MESEGSNDITGEGGDSPESSSKKPKLTNDSKEEERPSIHPLSEMEQPKRVDTFPELVGSSHPPRVVRNQVSRPTFAGQGSGVNRNVRDSIQPSHWHTYVPIPQNFVQRDIQPSHWHTYVPIPQNFVQRDIQPSHGPPEKKDKKGLNLVRIDRWRPLSATELDIRMLEELMSTNFLQPSQSWITQIEQKFLVELDAGDFLFEEVTCHHQSSIRENFLSCHFSEDGRFLACAGHGRKVTIWNKEDSNFTTSQESHSDVITEVRFRSSHRLTTCATSSYDRTVKIWDAAYPHMVYATVNVNLGSPILSLDFHPRDRDLLCCCDANDFIQLWNISLYAYRLCYFKGGTRQVRFQPQLGKLLAAASGKFINIFETEKYTIRNKLEGHSKEVISICWDQSGNYIASVSEDEACFWSAAPEGGLPYVLACKHGKFESCIFHPRYPNLLIISGHKCLDFWIPQRGYSLDFLDDGGIFTGVATSPQTQMVASVSRDCVKLWKTCS